jgi:hypothetical protein
MFTCCMTRGETVSPSGPWNFSPCLYLILRWPMSADPGGPCNVRAILPIYPVRWYLIEPFEIHGGLFEAHPG